MKYKDLGKRLSKEEMKNVKGGGPQIPGCNSAEQPPCITQVGTGECHPGLVNSVWRCYCWIGSSNTGYLCNLNNGNPNA